MNIRSLIACFAIAANAIPSIVGAEQNNPAPAPASSRPSDVPVDLAKDRNLYVVGYSHLDTQWRWAYPIVAREFVRNTLKDNFPLLEKYPNYVFNFSGSRRYQMMSDYFPDDYRRVKDYVAQGRWFPAGSSIDETDANVPSMESLIRSTLYGNRFFDRELGVHSDEFMLPDCFGFPASLPSVLAHLGVKGFSTQKLTWRAVEPIPFKVGRWIGPDGKSVVSALDPGAYGDSVTQDLSKSESWLARINNTGEFSGVFADYHYYGTGDVGGAPTEESVKWVEKSLVGGGPIRVISSRADQMFKDITPEQAAKLPSYKGELLLTEHSAGSITSQAYMKRWNRKNELLAQAAETAASAAFWLKALPYPNDKLLRAWDLVVGSQMHDILPGTSIPPAYQYSWNDEVLALNHFAAISASSSAAIIAGLDTRGEGQPVVAYNPLAAEREDVLEAQLNYPGVAPTSVSAVDADGREVPVQIVDRTDRSLRIALLARVPSAGYAVFWVRPSTGANASGSLKTEANRIENERYRVTLNAAGDVASIFDKAANRELLSAPHRLVFQYERPTQYPAWNMDWADRVKPPTGYVDGEVQVRVVEQGSVRVALEVTRKAKGSTFVQRIRLAAGDAGNRVEFVNKIDWRTAENSLRAAFPLSVANREATYDGALGVVVRPNSSEKIYEYPHHQWFDVTAADASYGVAVMNDSKFGSDKPDDRTVRLTLLYTPGVRNDYLDQASQDVGRHDITYAISGHAGGWQAAGVPWQAARVNQPLQAYTTDAHAGPLGKRFSFVRTSNPLVQVSAVKKAEDSDEVIVRVRELGGTPARNVAVQFAQAVETAREIDGQERPLGAATVQGGALTFDLTPFTVRAFAVKLAQAPAVPTVTSVPLHLPYDTPVASVEGLASTGSFDNQNNSYPAELLPATLVNDGITLQLGSNRPGAGNALKTRGQSLDLPQGRFNRLYMLAAAVDPVETNLSFDGHSIPWNVSRWRGFVGQWDDRLWDGEIPEISYNWPNRLIGLQPGYVQSDQVAFFTSHFRSRGGKEYYQYAYMYQYEFPIPEGATSVTLPNNPSVRVFAITAANVPSPATQVARPLYDTLQDHQPGGVPEVLAPAGEQQDATLVTLRPPLYYRDGDLRYTTDGSDPTLSSATYTGPQYISKTTEFRARQVVDGKLGPIGSGRVVVNDRTKPTVNTVRSEGVADVLHLRFSEPVAKQDAEQASHYSITPSRTVRGVTCDEDGMGVRIALGEPLELGAAYTLRVADVADLAPSPNRLAPVTLPVSAGNIAYEHKQKVRLPAEAFEKWTEGLPMKAGEPWTVNVFIKPDQPIPSGAIVVGFGTRNLGSGKGRFLLSWVDQNPWFWASWSMFGTESRFTVGEWQMFTMTYDGHTVTMYRNGHTIGRNEMTLQDDEPFVQVGPNDIWDKGARYSGELRDLTIWRGALARPHVRELWQRAKPQE